MPMQQMMMDHMMQHQNSMMMQPAPTPPKQRRRDAPGFIRDRSLALVRGWMCITFSRPEDANQTRIVHTRPMFRKLRSMTPFLWVVALALLGVRTSDAHVHLCFDGQEPSASLHVSDTTALCHVADDRSTHQDQDVDALGVVLAKKDSHDFAVAPLPIADIVLMLLAPPRSSVVREVTTDVLRANRPYWHLPLLRGPPA